MGRIITIASHKGGVGKTTTALNLGYALGRFSGKTLVIDLDPQSGMTIASNVRNRTDKGLFDLLQNSCEPADVVAQSKDGSLSIVGSGTIPPEAMPIFEKAAWDGSLGTLIKFLSIDFENTVIDAPAGLNGPVHAALGESDGVLLVANCAPITLKSIPSFLKLVDHVAQEKNAELKLEGVLLSMVDTRSATGMEIFNEVQEILPIEIFFRTVIPYDERFIDASNEAAPVAMLSSGEELDQLFLDLAMELKQRQAQQEEAASGSDEISGLF